MTAGARGGHRAALPAAGWEPPARLVTAAAAGAQARFIEELSGQSVTFGFSGFPVAPAVQEWLARAFSRSTGPRSGAKRIATASNRYYALKGFADSLSSARPPVQVPGQLGARHIVAFRAGYDGRPGLPRHLPVQIAVADQIVALRPHLDPAVWVARYAPRLDQLAGIIGAYTAAEQEQARRALDERQRRLVDDLMDGRLDLR